MKHEIVNDLGGGNIPLQVSIVKSSRIELELGRETSFYTMSKDMALKLAEELLDHAEKID